MAGARPSRFKSALLSVPDSAGTTEPLVWSDEQLAIHEWFATGTGNLLVRARAGTSKTTTALEGIRGAPERQILICAFNKKIADELTARLNNPNATAKTLHALGFAAIRRYADHFKVLDGSERANDLAGMAARSWKQDHKGVDVPWEIKRLVALLCTKAREMTPIGYDETSMIALAHQFNYLPDEGWGNRWTVEHVANLTLRAMDHAAAYQRGGIDFADMIFLPLVKGWLSPTYDLVVVDEAQDMNLAQLTICERVNRGRMAVIGDDRQAIYGFRGADTGSLDRLKRSLRAAELPLTTTYRCGRDIVEHAQLLVPDITARAGAPLGEVTDKSVADLMAEVAPGDFVLSRLNAPLVGLTLALLAQRVPAYMAGRDIGQGIETVLRLLKLPKGLPCDEMLVRLEAWRKRRVTTLANRGLLDQVDRLNDQADMIKELSGTALDADDVVEQCRELFKDADPSTRVMCSSIHKAKGLEASRVWVLTDTLYRRGRTTEEENLEYVAITRAKTALFLVRGVGGAR